MAIVTTNPDDPVSLKNMFPPKIAHTFETIPPYMAELDEHDLIQEAKPNETDWKLRIRLWQEYRQCVQDIKGARFPKVKTEKVCEGICSGVHFLRILDKPHKAAFILRPMQDFEQETELQLQIGARRLYEILGMDIKNPKTGQVDPKLANVLVQTIAKVADRARGLAIARTQAINYNLNQESPTKEQSTNPQDLDKRLQELEGKLGGSIDAEYIESGDESRGNSASKKEKARDT